MRIPKSLNVKFAVCVEGNWARFSSERAAGKFAREYCGAARPKLVEVVSSGVGRVLPIPTSDPYGNRSGKHVAKRRMIGGTPEQWAELQRRATTDGMPLGEYFWAQLGLSKKSTPDPR